MRISFKIDSLAFGGNGIGRHEGKVIFVPYSAPGDEVEVEIINERKRYSYGEIVRILRESEFRRNAECKYFGLCGGCQWQHIIYERQLKSKEGILSDAVQRIGKCDVSVIHNIIKSPREFRYRHRIRFHKKGDDIGFYKLSSNRIINIEDCVIAHEKVISPFRIIRRLFSNRRFSFLAGDIELTIGDYGKTLLISSEIKRMDALELFEKLKEDGLFSGLIFKDRGRLNHMGNPYIYFKHEYNYDISLKMRYHAIVFTQANWFINKLMIQDLLYFINNLKVKRVLDLFCGAGNLSVPVSFKVEYVEGIDICGRAIEDAKENAKENGRENCNFMRSSVEQFFDKGKIKSYELVIIDPPREGIKNHLNQILSMKPRHLCYISCDPITFCRDLRYLRDNGYFPIYIRPYDMFPQTYHMEIMAFMERRLSSKNC